MGEIPADLGRDGSPELSTGLLVLDFPGQIEEPPEPNPLHVTGKWRFACASLVGGLAAAVPYLWLLWGVWQPPKFFRKLAYEDNFYDVQARALLHGNLSIPRGSIGIEGFIQGGRTYTYFGLFSSILRMPVLVVSHSFDGRLTAPSMLLGWIVGAVFFVLLAWRVRVLVRGEVAVGWAEATSFGLLTFTYLGGSVFLWLGSTPYVFSEDLVWSAALTVGCLFALLGVADRPTWGRVGGAAILMILANQDRSTTGWAMTVGAFLLAGWFALGRAGAQNRRWWWPLAGAGLVALLLGAAANYAKFRMLFGIPIDHQVYSITNAYRRRFLASNHNSEVGTAFIPSNLLAYLRPDGIQFSSIFPFVTLPASPAPAVGGVLFDRLYRTASLPASMPLLSGLSIWGFISAFRRRPPERVARTRLLLLAAASAGAALMVWGYIGPRYLADFLPFLAIGSAVGLADIWRRQEGQGRSRRVLATLLVTAVAGYSLVANIGIAVTPSEEWTTAQTLRYVQTQQSWSGVAMQTRVGRSDTLTTYAPAGQIRIVGACDAMYISNGENFAADPNSLFTRKTWQPVQYGPAFLRTFYVTPRTAAKATTVPLVRAGPWVISVVSTPLASGNQVQLTFPMSEVGANKGRNYAGYPSNEPVGGPHRILVLTDPLKHIAEVAIDGLVVTRVPLVDGVPLTNLVTAGDGSPINVVSVLDGTSGAPQPTLCLSLLPGIRR
jgi:hypothetical protein